MKAYTTGNIYGMVPTQEANEVLATAFRKGTVFVATIDRVTTNLLERDATLLKACTLGLRVIDYDGQELNIK